MHTRSLSAIAVFFLISIVTNLHVEFSSRSLSVSVHASAATREADEMTATQAIVLKAGYNLVSWSVDTPCDSISCLIDDIVDHLLLITSYDQGGLTYDPAYPPFSTLSAMDHLHGYWFRMSQVDTLVLTGNSVAPTTPIQLDAGWNLVSYLPAAPESTHIALASVMPDVDGVFTFDHGGFSFYPDLQTYSTARVMEPLKGYWIKMTSSAVLTYPDAKGQAGSGVTPEGEVASREVANPTTSWINVYAPPSKALSKLLGNERSGIIEAFDPQGTKCGEDVLHSDGSFGVMPIYQDDPYTSGVDEGASPGSVISFKVNGKAVSLTPTVTWTNFGDVFALDAISFLCGDADNNGSISVSDPVYLLNYIFSGGPEPVTMAQGDADDCGSINVTDVHYLVRYIFSTGLPPCAGGTCTLPTNQNAIILSGCPYSFPDESDSIGIPVYIRNELQIGAFSLGFSYDSDLYEMTSAVKGPGMPSGGSFYVRPRPAENKMFVGWVDLMVTNPIGVHASGSEALLFTMYLRKSPGASSGCIDINSSFVDPAGPFIFSAQTGGTIVPALVDCGTCDVQIGSGNPVVSSWSFGNSEANMWPESHWGLIGYCGIITPCERCCILCEPSDFPDWWELFVSALGTPQCYFDPPPGPVKFRPSALAQWTALKGPWSGSCFGFAATEWLYTDGIRQVATDFPGYGELDAVPLSDAGRAMINKYYLYQFAESEQEAIAAQLGTVTPVQTLNACRVMLASPVRNDRVLMLFNNNGPGGHAVVPWEINAGSGSIQRIFVFDSNHPNDSSRYIAIDTVGNAWYYAAQPSWGGSGGLMLLSPVSQYESPLILMDTASVTQKTRFYFGEADSALFSSVQGTIGFGSNDLFGTVSGGVPITPATGTETWPIGYLLPTGDWYCSATGVVDGIFAIVDGEHRIFRHGGAKSGIISCYYRADAVTPSLTVYPRSGGKGSQGACDSNFIEVISIEPDSEVVVTIWDFVPSAGDSARMTLTADYSVQFDNFGAEASYDLQIQIVSPTVDTTFYHQDVPIGEETSHLIMPDWRPNSDSIEIMIDTGMIGTYDSTEMIGNAPAPSYRCGDADGSGSVSISDAVYLINYIFGGGPAPSPLLAGDADCSNAVSISDAVYLINYIFAGGPQPCAACP
ncbi:MAG: hypothetical protein IT585_12415 [candidate division Zixibacteria bacterium]|nr:hypothetical protein [candidate division Zixibacteria bacterium]